MLESELRGAQQRIESLSLDLEHTSRLFKDTEADLGSQIAALRERLAASTSECEQLSGTVASLKAELEQSACRYADEKVARGRSEERAAFLENDKRQMAEFIARGEARVAALEKEKSQLIQSISGLEAQVQEHKMAAIAHAELHKREVEQLKEKLGKCLLSSRPWSGPCAC